MESNLNYTWSSGCTPKGRLQNSTIFFFGIGSVKDLVPEMKAFGQPKEKIHIDAWREITSVDNYAIEIILKDEKIAQLKIPFFY
jgi:hypothetical protein